MDTIISQDSFVQKFSEDERQGHQPVWSSPLIDDLEEDEVSSQHDRMSTVSELESIDGLVLDEEVDDKFRAAESMREKFEAMRKYKSMISSFNTTTSLDDSVLNTVRGWQEMRQSLSQDEISILREKLDQSGIENQDILMEENEDEHSLKSTDGKQFNVWKILNDDFDDFGFAFSILGTSADDIASTPHVLSPPLMESIYHFLPYSVSEQNYFMKYSLLRDGASFMTLLQNIRGSMHTILALETTEGEVFGSFTSAQW